MGGDVSEDLFRASCGSCGTTRVCSDSRSGGNSIVVGVSLSKVTVTTEEGVRLLRPSTREIKPRSDRAFGPPISAEAGRPSRSASNEARTVSAGKSVDSVVVIKAGVGDGLQCVTTPALRAGAVLGGPSL